MDEKRTTKGRGFSSPLMMAISLIAASVGTGNIWRFPRVMATNGGSAFVVAYVVIMLIAVIPVMMGEHVIGRCTRKGLPGAFRDFLGSRKATWLGTFVEWVVIITIAYYTVVVAWIFQYLGKSITGSCFVAALKEEGNVLLLDEPTNDIDVNTLRALEEGLENFAWKPWFYRARRHCR